MEKLYDDLAEVYEAMYQSFIDYKDEFNFYSNILTKYNKKGLLEIGSGTGNLAKHFLENNFEYCGLDLSKEMIAIAREKVLDGKFIEGDMRDFKLAQSVESILITGRSISYLQSNEDVNATFSKVHEHLERGGIFCFDFIDAYRFIPEILKEKNITHKASYENINYQRKGTWELNLKYGMDLKWTAKYYKEIKNEWIEIGIDNPIVRTFSKDEIEIFLTINNFKIKEVLERVNYTFPTLVIVAERIEI